LLSKQTRGSIACQAACSATSQTVQVTLSPGPANCGLDLPGMKLYNDQRNAQVFNLFIYLHLPYMFRAFF
jgi:hypothetical protein